MRKIISALILLFLLVSCAQTPRQMNYFTGDSVTQDRLWPELPAVPRYRYAGQLIGEQNFSDSDANEPGTFAKILSWIIGIDNRANTARTLMRPQSGMTRASTIYVTDVGRASVFAFDTLNAELNIFSQADNGAVFMSPIGIAAGENNTLLVADSELKRIVILSAEGEPLGSFGQNILARPTGVARDTRTGLIFVVDTAEHNIKIFNSKGDFVRGIGRSGTGPGEFNAPTHIAIHDGKLYVTDTLNARVQILSTQGEHLLSIGQRGLFVGNLTRPKGVAVDYEGNIYIVESYYDHLLVFNSKGEYMLPIGGTGNAIGQFYLPAGIWVDDGGKIFIADMYNGRIVMLQALGG